MRLRETLRRITADLKRGGIENPHKEAEVIILHATGLDRESLFRNDQRVSVEGFARIQEFLERRLWGEPLQYILGYVDFYGLRIKVGKGVLIPRPETELLVDDLLKTVARCYRDAVKVLDLCTGSGCMSLAIAKDIPDAEVYATDMSGTALEYALENAQLHGITNVRFLQGDLFDPVSGKKFDIIASNPPYIKSSVIPDLQTEIRNWEPIEALDAGEDGLLYYKRIIDDLEKYLLDGGRCFLEIGFDQKDAIASLAQKHDLSAIFKKDLAGHDRFVILSF
jgi:release factor glutamine methyltransferase